MVGRGWWIHTTGRPPASPGRAKHPGVTVAVPQPECLQMGNRVSEGRDLFKEHLVLFREGFSSFFSSSELSATDVFSSSSFSSRFISLVPEETLLRPSPPDKPAEEAEGVGASWGGVHSQQSWRVTGSAPQLHPIPFTPHPTLSRVRAQPSPSSAGPGGSLHPQPKGQEHAAQTRSHVKDLWKRLSTGTTREHQPRESPHPELPWDCSVRACGAALPLYVSCGLLRSGSELGCDGSVTWLWSMLGVLDSPSSG